MSLQKFNFIQEDLKSLFSKVSPDEINSLKNSFICITGGAGFVGTWLAEMIFFLNENFGFQTKILIYDRDIEKIKANAPHLFNSNFFQALRADVRHTVELPKDVNYIVHAAGLPSSRDHVSNPIDVMSSIAVGTEVLLRTAERLSNLKMFMNLSSSLVYGGFYDRQQNIKETDYSISDESSISAVYAEAKRYSEIMTSAFRQQLRMPTVIVRPFSVVGPHQPLEGPWALNNFINDAINGRTIKVLGDGETVRSIMYASDMAFWILKTLVLAESGTKYNLGSPEPVTLKELSGLVRDQFNMKADILYYSGTGAFLRKSRMVPDTELIQSSFKLQITVPLKPAVERTIRWHQLERK